MSKKLFLTAKPKMEVAVFPTTGGFTIIRGVATAYKEVVMTAKLEQYVNGYVAPAKLAADKAPTKPATEKTTEEVVLNPEDIKTFTEESLMANTRIVLNKLGVALGLVPADYPAKTDIIFAILSKADEAEA